jgi:hypothetical protein
VSVSREVELKLEMPVAEVVRVQRSLRRRLGEGIKRHLISVYFDTGKRALRKRGLTLRTRSDGKRRVQTVKAADTTSGYIRSSRMGDQNRGRQARSESRFPDPSRRRSARKPRRYPLSRDEVATPVADRELPASYEN